MKAPEELIKKVKEGIIKSGFPLEMQIGSILQKMNWSYSIGSLYKDFETDVVREIDLSASKTLNGVAVHLEIACKKSEEKQLVLYAPNFRKKDFIYDSYFKLLPDISWAYEKKYGYSSQKIYSNFRGLDFFNVDVPISKKLIVTRGNTISNDNVKFLSDFNGLIKYSILNGSDGYIETGYRILYLYIMVFDGVIFNLIPSEHDNFNLQQCEYGQLLYEPNLKFSTLLSDNEKKDLIETSRKLGRFNSIIEIMTPEYFIPYIENIEKTFSSLNKKLFKNWGEDWPT
jgi:hypothetical protein